MVDTAKELLQKEYDAGNKKIEAEKKKYSDLVGLYNNQKGDLEAQKVLVKQEKEMSK